MIPTRLSPEEKKAWWSSVLVRDEEGRVSGETYRVAFMRRMRCVFCGRHLFEPMQDALRESPQDRGVAMLAYWLDDQDVAFASGLYCAGRARCLPAAERVGRLHDMHAEYLGGKHALDSLAFRTLDHHWDATALRRLVLVCAAMESLPTWRDGDTRMI